MKRCNHLKCGFELMEDNWLQTYFWYQISRSPERLKCRSYHRSEIKFSSNLKKKEVIFWSNINSYHCRKRTSTSSSGKSARRSNCSQQWIRLAFVDCTYISALCFVHCTLHTNKPSQMCALYIRLGPTMRPVWVKGAKISGHGKNCQLQN